MASEVEIDLGGSVSGVLLLRRSSDPVLAARAFLEYHSLPAEYLLPLSEYLREVLQDISTQLSQQRHSQQGVSSEQEEHVPMHSLYPSQQEEEQQQEFLSPLSARDGFADLSNECDYSESEVSIPALSAFLSPSSSSAGSSRLLAVSGSSAGCAFSPLGR